jgi:hypothetical protein
MVPPVKKVLAIQLNPPSSPSSKWYEKRMCEKMCTNRRPVGFNAPRTYDARMTQLW